MSMFRNKVATKQRLLKCFKLGSIFVLIYFLLSFSVELDISSQKVYQNIESFSNKHQFEQTKEKRIIEEQNTDEFILKVLQKYEYQEVNLSENISGFDIDELDNEIARDLSQINQTLGQEQEEVWYVENENDLDEKEIQRREDALKLLSSRISPNRTVPDHREEACKSIIYDEQLPDATVVIIFTNEVFSVLIRTIHSIINRTPEPLLREIVLVHDFSSNNDLKGKLERYVGTRFPKGKIRIVRILERTGLIRARMIGGHVAIGDVIVFMDAHTEVTNTWLEPLLQRIKQNRKAVVSPVIEWIVSDTFEWLNTRNRMPGHVLIVGFFWDGGFDFRDVPSYEANRKEFHHSPTRSPVMLGSIFAIHRKYFWEIGSYDPEMNLWGGENLELPFRVWQCGGSVEVIPCSRTGHLFRNYKTYSDSTEESNWRNIARVAEIWMDEYKEILYFYRPHLKNIDVGDIEPRKALRRRLNCKSFRWYMDNVYNEMFNLWLDSKYYGQIKNLATNKCLSNLEDSYRLKAQKCYSKKLLQIQTFYLAYLDQTKPNNSLVLRIVHKLQNKCATTLGKFGRVIMSECQDVNDIWNYKDGLIIHERRGKCLTMVHNVNNTRVLLRKCTKTLAQKWTITNFGLNKSGRG